MSIYGVSGMNGLNNASNPMYSSMYNSGYNSPSIMSQAQMAYQQSLNNANANYNNGINQVGQYNPPTMGLNNIQQPQQMQNPQQLLVKQLNSFADEYNNQLQILLNGRQTLLQVLQEAGMYPIFNEMGGVTSIQSIAEAQKAEQLKQQQAEQLKQQAANEQKNTPTIDNDIINGMNDKISSLAENVELIMTMFNEPKPAVVNKVVETVPIATTAVITPKSPAPTQPITNIKPIQISDTKK